MLISSKLIANKILILDEINCDKIATKSLQNLLQVFNLQSRKNLLMVNSQNAEENRKLFLSARNLKHLTVTNFNDVSKYDLFGAEKIIILKNA
jgi:ribosomal protein L4